MNHSGVMSSDELANLEDAMAFHRSADLEFAVRTQAAHCAESCLASGQPWRCYFMEPFVSRHGSPYGSRAAEVTVDVRGVSDPYAATLLAEEQIRRQLAKLPWAKLPDLAASR